MKSDRENEQLAELDKAGLIALISELRELVAKQAAQLQDLSDQLAKHSGNSGKPPSSDGLRKPRSQRVKGQRASGGQPGHEGHTLKMVEQPDHIERHEVNVCPHCATDLNSQQAHRVEKRQVFDLPAVKLDVTEHQAEVKQCPGCRQEVKGQFPPNVTQPVQYGPRFKAQAVYLNSYQLIPLARTCEVLGDFYGHTPSQALVCEALTSVVEQVQPIVEHIKQAVTQADMAHFDESGVRVEGHLNWLHVASTATLTYYAIHPRRGQVGMSTIGILPEFRGHAVHDHWPSYLKFDACQHAFCNAHHLRELQFITDQYQQDWAADLKRLLLDLKAEVEATPPQLKSLPLDRLAHYQDRFDTILHDGWAANPPPKAPPRTRRGRKKQSRPATCSTALPGTRCKPWPSCTTSASRLTTTRLNATSAWSSSKPRFPALSVLVSEPMPSAPCAAISPPSASTAPTSSNPFTVLSSVSPSCLALSCLSSYDLPMIVLFL